MRSADWRRKVCSGVRRNVDQHSRYGMVNLRGLAVFETVHRGLRVGKIEMTL
jgi:hypothetical protein